MVAEVVWWQLLGRGGEVTIVTEMMEAELELESESESELVLVNTMEAETEA